MTAAYSEWNCSFRSVFFRASRGKKEQIHISGHEQGEDRRAHHCKQIMWETFFVSRIKDRWTMENGLLYSLFLHRAIGLTASKDTEIKMCQSDSFLSLVYDISTGRKECGALFIFTPVFGVSKPSFLKASLPPCVQETAQSDHS